MAEQLRGLKTVTDILTLCADRKEDLQRVIPSLVDHISSSGQILCGRVSTQHGAEGPLVIKFKKQISGLLKGNQKDLYSKWAAVVLIKTTIEAVARHPEVWDFLQTVGSWVEGLVAIITKRETNVTKTMAMITLTRIFLLIHGRPTLTKELTTQNLKRFVEVCLNAVTIKLSDEDVKRPDTHNPLLETVLQSFIRLLPNHPAVFRQFTGQIRNLLGLMLAPTPFNLHAESDGERFAPSQKLRTLTRTLYALLPLCAPKNGAPEEWRKHVESIMSQLKRTADVTFRSIRDPQILSQLPSDDADEPRDRIEDELNLPGWHGIPAGVDRICGLLDLLSAHISIRSKVAYRIPIRTVYDLSERFLSTIPPQESIHNSSNKTPVNRQFTQDERQRLYLLLPKIHIHVLDLLSTLLRRMSVLSYSIAEDILEQICWLVKRSSLELIKLRVTIYHCAEQIISMIGPSLQKDKGAILYPILRKACMELADFDKAPPITNGSGKSASNGSYLNADSFTNPIQNMQSQSQAWISKIIRDSSLQLLCTALTTVPSTTISRLRTDIDDIAMLLQHEPLQLASISNPQSGSKHGGDKLISSLVDSKSPLVQAVLNRRLNLVVHQEVTDHDEEVTDEDDHNIDIELGLEGGNRPQSEAVLVPQTTVSQPSRTWPSDTNVLEQTTASVSVQEPINPHQDLPETTMPKRVAEQAEDTDQPAKRLRTEEVSPPATHDQIQAHVIQQAEQPDLPKDAESSIAEQGYETESSMEIPEIVVDFSSDDEGDDDETQPLVT